MSTQLYELKWAAERSVRYHSRRVSFYESADNLINVATLLLGSASVVALLESMKPVALTVGTLVAVFSFIGLVMKPALMSALHARLRQRFIDLSAKAIGALETDQQLVDSLLRERLEIERDEPPVLRALDLICHNELCLAQGKDDPSCLYYLPPFVEKTASFINWDTNHIGTLKEFRDKKSV